MTQPWSRVRSLILLAITLFVAGCVTPSQMPPAPATGTDAADPGDDVSASPTGATGRASTSGVPPADPTADPDPLTDFEDALAGTWRRHHVKNSGYSSEHSYYEYVAFNENRTACRWKYGEEYSSSSTDEVFDSSDYPDWRITEELSGAGTSFRVVVEGRGLDYVFDFTENRVYPAGFETLLFGPTADGKSCVYRGGASY